MKMEERLVLAGFILCHIDMKLIVA
jgi:hypothetical protein